MNESIVVYNSRMQQMTDEAWVDLISTYPFEILGFAAILVVIVVGFVVYDHVSRRKY